MVLAADAIDLARAQTAFSLAFHICFAVFGVGLPWMLVYTEWRWLRTGDPVWLALTKKWSRAFAVLFAVGAVSGTVLSFEFGLLWPAFMSKYGGALGLSFTMEGFAFFTEAIFVGMYLYGWKRLSARAHWLTLWPIAISGTLSTLFIITVNAWMNVPRGITERDGRVIAEEPLAPFTSPSFGPQLVHMLLAAFMCAGGMVAAIYAVGMLRGRRDTYHRRGLAIGLTAVLVAAPLQLIAGDWAGRSAGEHQPLKLAAMEGLYHTGSNAPFTLGGIYDDKTGEVRGGLEIPGMLSLLEGFSTNHVMTGLDSAPPEERPDGTLVHGAFTVMIVLGSALIALSGATGFAVLRRRRRGQHPLLPTGRPWLLAAACTGPAAMLAMIAGWEVTEGGRQPWIVGGHMKVVDAVTGSDGAAPIFAGTLTLYLGLAGALILILRRMATGGPSGEQLVPNRPSGPSMPSAPRPRDGGRGTGPGRPDRDGDGSDGSDGKDDDKGDAKESAPAATHKPTAVREPVAVREPAATHEPAVAHEPAATPARADAGRSATPYDPAAEHAGRYALTPAGAPVPAGVPPRTPAGRVPADRVPAEPTPADRAPAAEAAAAEAAADQVPVIPHPRHEARTKSERANAGRAGLFGRPSGRHAVSNRRSTTVTPSAGRPGCTLAVNPPEPGPTTAAPSENRVEATSAAGRSEHGESR
ncbi:cytochrome ubiquinol oxidase subunit I [Frankia sp. Ag45/Mut15]|uniref:Cytochrome ubiquinol oxidase subunit I n=1 Tax=Frankia umida TaxID=573489 RepID=A0ABT0JVH8_9ACTN|nr:cytochrome ubiquinol oxidase subunit I [Frankia umida]MCK9875534.1 cytochrome ubiquinol oxidase subunit I [Frankia umida]